MQQPLILAFDTSTASCDVAMLRGHEVIAERSEPMAKGQAERLLSLCQEVMAQVGTQPSDLTAIGVGIGPGNFTGIRISVSAARGLALGLGIPAVGVSAFQALGFGANAPFACAIDARRDQLYLQCFDKTGAKSDPELLEPFAPLKHDGPLIGHGGCAPAFSAAVAIAHVAREKFGTTKDRPAPLYIRPADAAPARDAPPKILT
ncbi:MAG: tRNA (adenosine(37)-N6)-threonylcarbamoyltransferase complex dimerization subunit type 1 TsaB [Roseobacter sp.]